MHFRELDSGQVLISNLVNNYFLLESKNDLISLVKGSVPKSLSKPLEQGLFISSESDFESKVKLTASAFSKNLNRDLQGQRLIMIVPTLRCDHSCTYCQVSRANLNDKGFDLPLSLIPNLIEFILKVETPPYKIEFQGGEPLLALDFIKMFYEQFAEKVSEDNFSIVIATSLSLVDEEILDYVKEKNIGFSTSIDSGSYAHNKHRRLIKKNSFELMKRNTLLIKEKLGNDRLGTVTTVTNEGLNSFNELVDTHIELGIQDLFVRPVSSFGFAAGRFSSAVSVDEFVDFLKNLILRLIKEFQQGRVVIEHFFFIHYKRLINAAHGGYVDLMSPAGYAKQSLIIDYTGNIFGSDEARMIYRRHGGEELVLGTIETRQLNLDTSFSSNLLSQSFNFDIPGCSDCVYQNACGSDPIYHIQEQGEPIGNKSKSAFCELHKKVFDLVIKLRQDPSSEYVFQQWLAYE
ncbi:His-Xaa-Ser system radical SAM maturase HxsB [Pseudoalteromonas sp. Isolate6]|uniref:His-Xaa-Ser system radical SAM maturase HxsB n=1 Tax=Pseudoalteromonas sp. Isolate6 TaxID=2908527 RepID=UPI001EFD606F|nr:His-Xaa-Ser system radical SAM maturase HxsB [Pseudoalteromonas sp. Isolate6]MCG9760864.1 His-Xaa-Ser system radical SAM maturase HxsB [Pseudoalteromonas sp. Isolate6]